MVAASGNTLEEERPREYNGNSTEFKFVFKSYSGVVARTTDLVALMSSMSKMRTGFCDRSAAESWLIPMECGWENGKNKELEAKGNENPKSRLSSNCRKWCHNNANAWHGKEKQVNRVQFVVHAGGHRCRHHRARKQTQKRACLVWCRWFHNDQTVLRALCHFRACVSKSYATYETLSLKVWSVREVVSNEMNLHGDMFKVKVFAVVSEGRRRQLLSMIWWEIEGFLLTVGCPWSRDDSAKRWRLTSCE